MTPIDATASPLFTSLSTYQPNGSITPEENFSTELLVHLLRFSLNKGTALFSGFADRFLQETIPVSDYGHVRIDTQELFYTNTSNKAFPDITVRVKDRYLFIEVKVESGLNHYEVENGENTRETINQLRKYQGIPVEPKGVYLLTKYPCEVDVKGCDDFKGRFKWHDIHLMLKEYRTGDPVEGYLVQEMIAYMEDKGMSIPKVTFEFVRGMEMLNGLFQQIETALEGRLHKTSIGAEWMGYYLPKKAGAKAAGKDAAWVGNWWEGNRLVFEQNDPKVVEHIKKTSMKGYEIPDKNKSQARTFFDFEERKYFCLTAEQQVDALKKWIDENCGLIEKYGG